MIRGREETNIINIYQILLLSKNMIPGTTGAYKFLFSNAFQSIPLKKFNYLIRAHTAF